MSQDFKVPPSLGPDTVYETWRNEIQVWELVTDTKPEKQALAVALSLTGQARAKALEIEAAELNTKDGMNTLLKALDDIFLSDQVDLAYCAYSDFDRFKKAQNMSMNDFITEYERRYNICRKYQMEYPEAVLAFKLLDNAGLSQKERQLVLAAASDRKFSSMKAALKMTFGNHPETEEVSEAVIGQHVVERLKTDLTRVEGQLTHYMKRQAELAETQRQMHTQLNALKLQADSQSVAFTVRLAQSKDNAGKGFALGQQQTVVFDDVVTNVASAYDPQCGIFTTPTDGTYVFFLTMMTVNDEGPLYLTVVKNGNDLDMVHGVGKGETNDQGSTQVTTQLTTGDRVWIRNHSGTAVRGSWWTVFSGFRLN